MTIWSTDVYEQRNPKVPKGVAEADLKKLVLNSMNGQSFVGHIEYRSIPTSALLFQLQGLPNPENYKLQNAFNAWSNAEVQLAQGFIKSSDEVRGYINTILSNLSTPHRKQ